MKNLSKKILLTLLATSFVSMGASMATDDESLRSGVNGQRIPLITSPALTNYIVEKDTVKEGCWCCTSTRVVSLTITTTVGAVLENIEWFSANATKRVRNAKQALEDFGIDPSSTFTILDHLFGTIIAGARLEDKITSLPNNSADIRTISASQSVPGIPTHTARSLGTGRGTLPKDTLGENVNIVRAFCTATRTLDKPIKVLVLGDGTNPVRSDVSFLMNDRRLESFWAPLVALGLVEYKTSGVFSYSRADAVKQPFRDVRALFIQEGSPGTLRTAADLRDGAMTGGRPAVTFAATHDTMHDRQESRGSSVNSSPRRDDVLLDVKMELGFTFSDDTELAAFAGGRLLMNERDNVKQLREFLEKADHTIDAGVIAADKFGIRLRDEIDGLLEKQAKTVAIALLSIIKQNASSLTLTAAENPLAFAMLPYLTGTAEIPIYVGDMLSAVSHFGFTHGHQYYFGTSTGKANAPLEDLLSIVSELTGTVSEIDPSRFAE